jgi:hypothetical protein
VTIVRTVVKIRDNKVLEDKPRLEADICLKEAVVQL